MQSKVAPYAATPDPAYTPATSSSAQDSGGSAKGHGSSGEADLRLIIEEDAKSGLIVYKRISRETGRVAAEFSREFVLKMKDDGAYLAGSLIDTKA
jgi:hypothetical protein